MLLHLWAHYEYKCIPVPLCWRTSGRCAERQRCTAFHRWMSVHVCWCATVHVSVMCYYWGGGLLSCVNMHLKPVAEISPKGLSLSLSLSLSLFSFNSFFLSFFPAFFLSFFLSLFHFTHLSVLSDCRGNLYPVTMPPCIFGRPHRPSARLSEQRDLCVCVCVWECVCVCVCVCVC